MKKKLLMILISLLFLTACTNKEPELQRFQKVIGGSTTDPVGFDTSFTLIAYTENENKFNQVIDQLRTEMSTYHKHFDKYNTYEGINNLKTINDQAGKEAVVVNEHIIKMLLMAKEQFDENYQKFDPTLGAVLEIWHDYREKGNDLNSQDEYGILPPLEELQTAKECTGWDLVEIDESQNSVYLKEECASLDLGGIAKGYATELVAQTLYESGLKHFSLSSGGNVKVMGLKPDGTPWKIGIGEPAFIPLDTSVDVLTIDEELSIVTSGDYQRYFFGPDMEIVHHLIDPETLFPLHYYRSATIVTKDSGYADLYSTVLYLLDYETGKQWIKQHNEKHPDLQVEAYWVIDETSELWNHEEFMTAPVNDKTYKVAMTDGLRSKSRLLNP